MSIAKLSSTDQMRSTINRGLMVAWINADLIERSSCDVRRSIVLYDVDGMFVHALHTISETDFVARLETIAETLQDVGVASWSVGIV